MTGYDRAAFGDLLSALPVSDVARDDLVARMGAPDRHYHNIEHIVSMWSCHLALGRGAGVDGAPARRRLACAIAFHDSVLVPGRDDNERRSADLWLEVSRSSCIAADDRLAVAAMIEATADHVAFGARAVPTTDLGRETLWLLDLDLASLGADRETFDRNTADLRQEARHLDERRWCDSLQRFFEKLLAIDPLYRCEPTATRFERTARSNMTRVLSVLQADPLPQRKLRAG